MGASHPSASKHINPNWTERVTIRFTPRACCGTSKGFDDRYRAQAPQQVIDAGITEKDWFRWVSDYEANVEPQSNVCCFVFWLILAWCLFIPGLIVTCCYKYGLSSSYHKAARRWLDRVNADLGPKGMFAKFQTMIEQRGRTRVEHSVLNIALTPRESAILMDEPIMVMPDCYDCCGFCAIDAYRVV